MKTYVIIALVAIVMIGFVGCESQNKPANTQPQQLTEKQIAEITQKSVDAAEKKVQASLDKKDKELQAEKDKSRKLEEKLSAITKTVKAGPRVNQPKSESSQERVTPATQASQNHLKENGEEIQTTESEMVSDNVLIVAHEFSSVYLDLDFNKKIGDIFNTKDDNKNFHAFRIKLRQIDGVGDVGIPAMGDTGYNMWMAIGDLFNHDKIINEVRKVIRLWFQGQYKVVFRHK